MLGFCTFSVAHSFCILSIATLFCGFTWLTFLVNPGLRRAVFEAGIGGSWDESIRENRFSMVGHVAARPVPRSRQDARATLPL